jgi:hypothetical protein
MLLGRYSDAIRRRRMLLGIILLSGCYLAVANGRHRRTLSRTAARFHLELFIYGHHFAFLWLLTARMLQECSAPYEGFS